MKHPEEPRAYEKYNEKLETCAPCSSYWAAAEHRLADTSQKGSDDCLESEEDIQKAVVSGHPARGASDREPEHFELVFRNTCAPRL